MPMAETQHGEVAGGEQPTAAMSQIQRPRRSPRRAASIPVWVRREGKGPTWEEETETQVLSRYGACLECRHAVEAGGILAILRRDNGQRVNGRVSYCRFNAKGHREIGIEFLNCDNFWDVDWNFDEPAVPQPETLRKPSGPAQNERPADKPRRKRHHSRGLANILVAKEKQLWDAIKAKNMHVLERLVARDCFWVTGEGVQVKSPDLQDLSEMSSMDCALEDFKVTVLNKAAAIVMFQGVERGSDDPEAVASLHSYDASVWANRNGKWQLVFHQQTRAW